MSLTTSIISIILLIILIILSGFFSAAETAYTSVKFSKIEADFRKGKKVAKLIKKHYKSFGWTLSTILLSNNIVNIGASALTTYMFTETLGASPTATLISIFCVTPVLVIFGEIIPKILARKYAYGYLKKIAYVMEFFNFLFWPFTFPLSKITIQSKITNSEKELSNLIRIAKSERVLDRNEAILVENALKMDETFVRKSMVKKDDVISIALSTTIFQAKKVFVSSGHSRLLVKDKGRYVGVLLLKDIIFMKNKELIASKVKPVIGVSKSKNLSTALEKMRMNKVHLAVVVEKRGSRDVIGIITIEDILEELIGEIYDEHDAKPKINEVALNKFVVEGSTKMVDVSKTIEFNFENMEDLTLKQWVQSRINRTIKKGLKYEYKDVISFKIIVNSNKKETLIEISKKIM